MLKLRHIFTGIAASLGLTLVFYWGLRLDSSLAGLINNTKSEPVYLWGYFIITLATVIIFGINFALLYYRIEKFGWPKFKTQSGSSLGAVAGLFSSGCPTCGSTLLSVVGLGGGLATLPFAGLELKALSLGMVAFSFVMVNKDIKESEHNECTECEIKTEPEEPEKPKKKKILIPLAFAVFFFLLGFSYLNDDPILKNTSALPAHVGGTETSNNNDLIEKVLPSSGWQSKISLGKSVLGLVEAGAIDREKFLALYKERGLEEEIKKILDSASNDPILLTQENASLYLNLLWPLGLSNFMEGNKESPVNGTSLFNFASTGGWTLGKAENGGEYFNKFKIVSLTPAQEKIVLAVAQNAYRPCCGNSAFFQDCNHGSALLGLIELGAAQGMTEKELWQEALAFNSFWFPEQYLSMAIYFKEVKGIDWENVDPKIALGKDYSTSSGFRQNVLSILEEKNLLPKAQGGGGCGV